MVRRNRNKQRGIQRGIEKHKIRSKVDEIIKSNLKILGIKAAQVGSIAEACFVLICRVSCSTYALPMEFYSGKLSIATSWKHLLIHYVWLVVVWTFIGIRTVIWVSLLLKDGLTTETLMSFTLLYSCLFCEAVGIGALTKVTETAQLVNSRKSLLGCLDVHKGRVTSEFEDLALSVKVIGIVYTMAISLPFLLAMNFIFPALPINLHQMLLSLGFGHSVPKIILQICCVPLEALLLIQPNLSAGFSIAVLLIGIDVLKFYNVQLR